MKRFLLVFFGLFIAFSNLSGQTTITASADTTICLNGSAHVSATVTGASFGTDSYTFEVYPYLPEPYTGGIPVSFGGNFDDQVSGPFEIGFNFCFFNQSYSSFCIGSNGWIGFTYPPPPGQNWNSYASQAIPSTNTSVPKNCIMAPWQDWWPNYYAPTINVFYYTTGVAPNRKLVVYWTNSPMFGCLTTYGSFQIVLNEQTGNIDNHLTNKPFCGSSGGTATQGVHRADGLAAFTATGRNSTIWTAMNESTRFVPSGIKWYVGGYPGGTIVGYGPTLTVSPTVTTTYTVVVETCGTGTATDDVIVTVVDAAFNYPLSSYCASDANPTPNIAQNGGVFSASPAGLVFVNTLSGEVNLASSIPGTYTITHTMTGNCTASVSHQLTIIGTPDPPVATPPEVSRCGPGDVTLTVTQAAGIKTLWYDAATGGNKYFFTGASVTTNVAVTTSFWAEAVTLANNCVSLTRTEVIATVKPIPDITNATLNFSLCSGEQTNISPGSSVANSTFTWIATSNLPDISGYSNGSGGLIQQTLVNMGNSAGTVTYTVTPTADGCVGLPIDFVVTVKPLPDLVYSPLSPSICSGQTTNIALSSHVLATTFTWTATPSSASVTGYSDGTGNTIAQTLVTPGTGPETVTYHVTPTSNGCSGASGNVVVLINPQPHLVTHPMSDTICSEETTNILLTSSCLNTNFTWSASLTYGNLTGFSGGIGSTIQQSLTNLSNINGEVLYSITPTAGSCLGTDTSFYLVVKPKPLLINNPAGDTICTNNTTNVTLLSNVAGTTFTWTATGSTAQVAGYSDNLAPTTFLNQTLVNSGFNVETVTYMITPHANGCDGVPTPYVVTVFPKANLSNSPASQSQCNNQATGISLTSNVVGTLFTWTATGSTAQVTGFSDNLTPTAVLNQTLVNSGNAIETVTYTLTPHANGCDGDPASYVVTVYPTPDLSNAPASQSQCNNQATGINLTSNVAGTLFTWTVAGSTAQVTGFSDNLTPSTLINQTLINSGFNTETVTYTITPHANGCDGSPTPFTVTVFPTPDLSNTPFSKSQCNNQSTGINLTSNVVGTLFTWTASGSTAQVTGYSDNTTPTTGLNQTLINSGFNVETVTYTITPHANGCDGVAVPFVVTIYPTPNLSNSPASKAQCNNLATGINLTSNVSGALFTWTASGSTAQVTGYSDNTTPTTGLNQTLINSGFNVETVTYLITPHANGCDGIPTPYTVTVYPSPDLSNTPFSKSQCNNQATGINLTSNVAGTLFTWTASGSTAQVTGFSDNATPTTLLNQTLVNSGFNVETVTYTLTPHAYGCDGSPTSYIVTVYPTPDLSNSPASKTQCNNLATGINLTSHVAGTLFTWTATGSTAQVAGFSNNLVPTATLNQTLINSGFNVETVTYTITPHANGCDGLPVTYTVTVNPTPNLSNLPLSKSQCNNVATGINLTSNVAGTLFTWTATGSTAQVTGFSDNTTPTVTLNQTLTNSGFTIETVTYQLTPHANGCSGTTTPYVVTVFPTPDLSNTPKLMQVCNNVSTNLTLTSHVAGTTFTWNCSPSSANVTGWSNNSSPTTLLNHTLSNSGLNVENVVYHMAPSANGCLGVVTDYTVSVVQSPDVYFNPSAQTICSQGTTSVVVLSHVPGTLFTWTAAGSSTSVSGFSDGNGPSIQQTLTNSGTTTESVLYTAYPSVSGCTPGTPQSITVTVHPKPAINNTITAFQQCSAALITINPTSTVPGSLYTWTATGSSAQVTGYSGNSVPTNVLNQTLHNSGFNIETVTYAITPIANNCPGSAVPFTVTVYPIPDVYFLPLSQAICPEQSSNITNNSHVIGSSFTWTAVGSTPLVSGFSAGSGSAIQQVLFNIGYNNETVNYTVAPSANGCPGIAGNVVVTVHPNPFVTLTLCFDPVMTTGTKPIRLKGGIPLNGTYSGQGVSAGIFSPSVSGTGTFPIKYIYNNVYGCSDTASQSVTVISTLPFSCGSAFTDPRDNTSYPTVTIGTQCWMAANLNYGTTVTASSMQLDNCQPEKYCYGDNAVNCGNYGGLYQWDEIMNHESSPGSQGLCPPEWHVPTENEWNAVFNSYISNGFAGSPLKNTGYSGFNASPFGVRFVNVNWNFINFASIYWSSNSRGALKAWAHGLNTENPSVSFYPASRSNAFPIRCIKD
jgi:uncharacterized protein (TIGR02145 family)